MITQRDQGEGKPASIDSDGGIDPKTGKARWKTLRQKWTEQLSLYRILMNNSSGFLGRIFNHTSNYCKLSKG